MRTQSFLKLVFAIIWIFMIVLAKAETAKTVESNIYQQSGEIVQNN